MAYTIEYYSVSVAEEILALPDTLAARYVVLTRRIMAVGPNLGTPHTEAFGDWHSWVASWLHTMADSSQIEELEAWGVEVKQPLRRALLASETANARWVLERGQSFWHFAEEGYGAEGLLSVRQVALLAGMEDMSVRTAISRKGPNQLPTVKDEQRTLIRAEDARVWLEAKGRRLTITRKWAGKSLDLSWQRFESLFDLDTALMEEIRRQQLEGKTSAKRIGKFDKHELRQELVFNSEDLTPLAKSLGLPAELLNMRARQARLTEQLRAVETSIGRETSKS